jgi:hypothetical protein
MKRIRRAYELFSELTAREIERAGKRGHFAILNESNEPIDWDEHINRHREGLASGEYEAVWFGDVLVTRPKVGD